MKSLYVIIFLFTANLAQAQVDSVQVFEWEELPLDYDPDTIFHLSFRSHKLDSLPTSLKQFVHLKSLDAGKNRLLEIPQWLDQFEHLESINLEKNRLSTFPIAFCRMPSLKSINLGMNFIEQLPSCIEYTKHLKTLLLYDNPIVALPAELSNLKNLSKIDLSGIRFSPEFQESWINRLPNVEFEFDAPCDCMR